MKLSKANLTVVKVVSSDPFQKALTSVRVEVDGTTVGSNGRVVMVVGPVDPEKVRGFPDVGEEREGGVNLPSDIVDKALRNMPKEKRPEMQNAALTASHDPGRVELTTVDRRQEQRVSGFPERSVYPDWKGRFRSLKAEGEGEVVRICLNRSDLLDLLKAMEEAAPDKGGVNPVFMELARDGAKGVLIRTRNYDTRQNVLGMVGAYDTKGEWLHEDTWERRITNGPPKRKIEG